MEKQIAQITAQEILRRKLPLGEFGHPVWSESYVISAMEEYAKQALSKAEDKWEGKSAVDKAWTYLAKCKHITDKDLGDGFPAYNVLRALQMVAKEQPTNSLDELESWVKENWFGANEDDMTYHENAIDANDLLAKIQSLKTITT